MFSSDFSYLYDNFSPSNREKRSQHYTTLDALRRSSREASMTVKSTFRFRPIAAYLSVPRATWMFQGDHYLNAPTICTSVNAKKLFSMFPWAGQQPEAGGEDWGTGGLGDTDRSAWALVLKFVTCHQSGDQVRAARSPRKKIKLAALLIFYLRSKYCRGTQLIPLR